MTSRKTMGALAMKKAKAVTPTSSNKRAVRRVMSPKKNVPELPANPAPEAPATETRTAEQNEQNDSPRFRVVTREALADGGLKITAVPVESDFPVESLVIVAKNADFAARFDTDSCFYFATTPALL